MRNIFKIFSSITILLLTNSCLAKNPSPPISTPIDLTAADKKTEILMRIKQAHFYNFELRFMFQKDDQIDRARVKKLVGEQGNNGSNINLGISTPLKIKIEKLDLANNYVIYEGDVSEMPVSSYGADHFTKIIYRLELAPGDYRVIILNKTAIRELSGTKTNVGIVRAYMGK